MRGVRSIVCVVVVSLVGLPSLAAPKDTSSELRRLSRAVSRLRQLRLRRPIAHELVDAKTLRRRALARLMDKTPKEALRSNEAVLWRLGLMPRGERYERALAALSRARREGLFDVVEGRLYLPQGRSIARQRPTLVHEICHALQAQNLRLRRFTRRFANNSDRRLARLALVQGDCTGVMLEDALRGSGVDLGSSGALVHRLLARRALTRRARLPRPSGPRFLRRVMLFPHRAGLRFVQRLRKRSGWRRINGLYRRRPPETSEQVLHYEKFRRRERPVSVRARQLPSLVGWRRIKVDTWGEALLRALLAEHLPLAVASRAAAGWGGDRQVAYLPPLDPATAGPSDPAKPTKPKPTKPAKPAKPAGAVSKGETLPLVLHLTVWDSAADAQEFHNAVQRWLHRRHPGGERAASSTLQIYRAKDGSEASVQRHGRAVALIFGAPPALRVRLQSQLWRRWRVAGRKVSPLPKE